MKENKNVKANSELDENSLNSVAGGARKDWSNEAIENLKNDFKAAGISVTAPWLDGIVDTLTPEQFYDSGLAKALKVSRIHK